MDKSLKPGDAAPDFSLKDQKGKQHTLGDYRNRWLVLYFYPKDDTPGCTQEACNFRDDHIRLGKMDADVLGVSIDNQQSHEEFANKYGLPFPLLADTDGKVSARYDSFFSLGPIRYSRRHTFIIDPAGRIAKVYRSVTPATHSDDVIRDLDALKKSHP
jgi:peroxiredoxin Q/BCP